MITLINETSKGRVYTTDSAQEAVGFAAAFSGSYSWLPTSDTWTVIINGLK